MLSKRLKEVRKQLGIRQEELADYLGVKRQTYSAYERAVSVPDSITLKKLADYFDVSIEEFFLDPQDATDEVQERQLLMLARKARKIPPEQRERLLRNFEENVQFYLDMMHLGDTEETE